MKNFICLLIAFLSLNALASGTESVNYRLLKLTQNISDLNTNVKVGEIKTDKENIEILKSIIKKSDDFLAISKEFSTRVINGLEENEVLQGDDLSTIDNLVRTLLIIADFNMLMVNTYYKNLDDQEVFKQSEVSPKIGALIAIGGSYNIFNLFNETYNHYFKNSALRRIVVDVYKTKSKQYPSLSSVHQHFKTVDSQKFRDLLTTWAQTFNESQVPLLKLMNIDVTRLVATIEMMPISKQYLATKYENFKYTRTSDFIFAIIGRISNFLSGLFGNVVGSVKWRKGYLDGHEWGATFLEKQLKPLDIIAEKTPFAATDLFIPGHFGHIALYLGTEEQLREIGLWNHPVIQPYQKDIQDGKVILESIRPGSRLTTLRTFMAIDEITVIRQRDILNNPTTVVETFKVGFEQLGKKYDFNFDVHTLDKVVCSEVVYHSFGHIKWPTAYIFGRYTISPDDVMSLAFWDKSPVKYEFAVISNKHKEITHISDEEMAQNLSFKFNKERTKELGERSFDQVSKKCTTVRKRDTSAHSHHDFKIVKTCKTQYKQLVYGL